ncbi:helix-turn-helix transcriptional regulator [Anaerosporobacter sp.]|uniref:helix-turn-helix transcriptional regulator n=1 Tax=Anaerosporobacter sp. TaxID=1872529 RepID=UPI00286F5590|nr:HTH domain-containing protein [Anaerosporobacter sp.]
MKMDRMISIIMILLERRRVSIPELAKICEVTTRTIQRDLDAINQAGVPIVSYPGVGGGVGIM